MIISVDHGNKSIKTPNALFTSGLISSEGLQGFKTDYICWNGRYYTLTEQRIAYLRDKTEDERFYVLTLFAIAKELERRKVPETLDPIDITLLVGLPPAHYEQLHSRFEQYFLRRREIVDFEYNGKYYSIRVSKVLSYPQAFAAAVTQFGTLKAHSVAYIIDIGGFTIDVLKLRSGHPDLAVVESFEKGVITLYNGIASKCNALYARILEDCDIDEVIRNQPTVLPGEVQQLIRTMTSDFLTEFYNFLRERGVDVSTSIVVLDTPILDTTQYKDLLGSVITDIVLAVLSFGAQLEVDTKSKAQAEGIAAAHLKGVKFGRPRCTVEGWDTYYPQWKQGQITAVQCYKQLGISASTFYRLVRKYELEDESE